MQPLTLHFRVYKVFSDTVFIKPRLVDPLFRVLCLCLESTYFIWPIHTPALLELFSRFLCHSEPGTHSHSEAWTFCATFTLSATTPDGRKAERASFGIGQKAGHLQDVDSRDEESEAHRQEATFSTRLPRPQRIGMWLWKGTFTSSNLKPEFSFSSRDK